MPQVWAGADIGKEHHYCVVISAESERLLSRRVLNDEAALPELIDDVLALSREVLWAVDLNHGGAALLIGLLVRRDQLIAYITGLAPAPRDSGRVNGNLRRPRRFHRGLLRVFSLFPLASLKPCSASRNYHQRKRNEGKGHRQALLPPARRRVNVLWALIRDRAHYQAMPPATRAA